MIRVGIIGGGGGIAHGHIRGMADTDGLELAWIQDVNAASAKARAAEHGVPAFTDYHDALPQADAVIICTPQTVRRDPVVAAARAGKHIYCEKPLALNLADGLAMADAVRAAGVCCQVGFNFRYEPLYRRAGLAFHAGELGRLVYIYVHAFEFMLSSRWQGHKASGHWRASYETSGGRIFEYCSHWLDWLGWIGGAPRRVTGHRHAVTRDIDVDDVNLMTVEFDEGTGRLELFRCGVSVESKAFGIVGTDASLRCDCRQQTLTMRRLDQDEETPVEPGADQPTRWSDWRDAMRAGRSPEADIEAGLTGLRMALAFNLSAERGQAVDLAELSSGNA